MILNRCNQLQDARLAAVPDAWLGQSVLNPMTGYLSPATAAAPGSSQLRVVRADGPVRYPGG